MIPFSNNGVIRVLCCCYGNIHLNFHILEFKKCFYKIFLLLKCINPRSLEDGGGRQIQFRHLDFFGFKFLLLDHLSLAFAQLFFVR